MTANFRDSELFFCVMILLMIPVEARTALVQEGPQSTPPPFIAVGQVEGSPGASLILPLYFTPDPKVAIRSFTVEIEYVSNNLEFQDASKGVADENGLEISSSLAKSEPDSKGVTRSKLRVTATVADKNSKQGLPEGLLAYLMFNLSADAKPFVIKMSPTIVTAEDMQKPSRKVSNLGAQPGSVVVLSGDVEPGMSCFFFTH